MSLVDRIVDGVVRDVLNQHPDYVTEKGQNYLAQSLAKRLAGQLESALADRLPGGLPGGGKGEGGATHSPPHDGVLARASVGGTDPLSGAPASQTCKTCTFLAADPNMGRMPARLSPIGHCNNKRPGTKVRQVVSEGTSCADWTARAPSKAEG